MRRFNFLEDTKLYYSEAYRKRILSEMFHNAYRTLRQVYILENFEEYSRQLRSDNQEDKKSEFWNSMYYEKLIDYIKISVAFETFNKAILIKNGYLIHKIKKRKENAELFKNQNAKIPVLTEDFLKVSFSTIDWRRQKIYLGGLNPNFETINYSDTLSEKYQEIIQLDYNFLWHLKNINLKRNRLHFFRDFIGAFSVESHLEKWKMIKQKSLETIEKELNNKFYNA